MADLAKNDITLRWLAAPSAEQLEKCDFYNKSKDKQTDSANFWTVFLIHNLSSSQDHTKLFIYQIFLFLFTIFRN